MHVEAFKPEHIKDIELNDPDTNVFNFYTHFDRKAEVYAKAGPAITLKSDDEVFAIGGVVQYWQGVGEAWLMVSPRGRNYWMTLYKTMDKFLNDCFENGFHRIHANVVSDYKAAHRCALKLGFIPEGTMIHFGPNKENFIRYARFR